MAEFDLVVTGGTVVTAADTVRCDAGIYGDSIPISRFAGATGVKK